MVKLQAVNKENVHNFGVRLDVCILPPLGDAVPPHTAGLDLKAMQRSRAGSKSQSL